MEYWLERDQSIFPVLQWDIQKLSLSKNFREKNMFLRKAKEQAII